MLRFAPLLLAACTGAAPTGPSDPPSVPSPAPAIPLVPCGADPTPFGFEASREPLFLPLPTEPLLRTYLGRVTVPVELNLDLGSIWLLDSPATITGMQSDELTASADFEVQATCTSCDHASIRIGSISSDVVLTAPTTATGDPVNATFTLQSTAFMVLGLSTADGGPALAEAIAYAQRPDLNSFVADVGEVMAIDVEVRGTTGINEHAQPAARSEVLDLVDDLLADPRVATVPTPAVPWLLPLAQVGVEETLVLWGPHGRSAAMPAVDGRFLVELPMDTTPTDYVLRFSGPDGQGPSATLRYPPDVGPGVVRIDPLQGLEGPLLDVRGTPGAWMALRTATGTPVVCRADGDGRSLFARPDGAFELVVVDPLTLELDAQRLCTQDGTLDCR